MFCLGKWDYVWLGEFGEVTNYHWEPLQENGMSRWTRVNLNSNRTDLLYQPQRYAASTAPPLSYVGPVSTLMARPDFLQYPAPGFYLYHCQLKCVMIAYLLYKLLQNTLTLQTKMCTLSSSSILLIAPQLMLCFAILKYICLELQNKRVGGIKLQTKAL